MRDAGPGVAPDDQERIFERFARASASRRRSEGAGLGLAIVRAIAEAHGGSVELSSRPGAGATFTVIVPAGGADEPDPDRRGRAAASGFLEKGLRAAGYSTTVCDDGIRPPALARDDDFDLLILDIGLPGQDGFAVLRAIRARGERLPVLVLTARDEVVDTVTGLDSGADDYVTKPFVFEELLARVRARLRAPDGAATRRSRSRPAGCGSTSARGAPRSAAPRSS